MKSGAVASQFSSVRDESVEIAAVASAGFTEVDRTDKVFAFRRASDGREIYLVRLTTKRKLVVHPVDAADADRALPGTGGIDEGLYHNDNMALFPQRRNKGDREVRYGRGYAFPTADGMAAFLLRLGHVRP